MPTSYRCDKLCGSLLCCGPLVNAIGMMSRDENQTRRFAECAPNYSAFAAECAAIVDLCDPAKLAELGAMTLRARGVKAMGRHSELGMFEYEGSYYFLANDDRIEYDCGDGVLQKMSLAQFRTLLARVMATPPDASSREQCERMIRGGK